MYFVCWMWYIKMKEVVTKHVANMRNVVLLNTPENRAFVMQARTMEKYADVNFVLVNVRWILGNGRWGKFHYYMLGTLPSTGQVITARLALGTVHGGQVERMRTDRKSVV